VTENKSFGAPFWFVVVSLAVVLLAIVPMAMCRGEPPTPAPGPSVQVVEPVPSTSGSAELLEPAPESTVLLELEDGDWGGPGGQVKLQLRSRAATDGPWDWQPYPWVLILTPDDPEVMEVCGFYPQLHDGFWRQAHCLTGDPGRPHDLRRLRLSVTPSGLLEAQLGEDRLLLSMERIGQPEKAP